MRERPTPEWQREAGLNARLRAIGEFSAGPERPIAWAIWGITPPAAELTPEPDVFTVETVADAVAVLEANHVEPSEDEFYFFPVHPESPAAERIAEACPVSDPEVRGECTFPKALDVLEFAQLEAGLATDQRRRYREYAPSRARLLERLEARMLEARRAFAEAISLEPVAAAHAAGRHPKDWTMLAYEYAVEREAYRRFVERVPHTHPIPYMPIAAGVSPGKR